MHLFLILLCGVTLVPLTLQASRILFLAPISFKSHDQFYASIVTTLARQGHEMTFVSSYPMKEKTPRVQEIVLQELDLSPFMPNVFEDGNLAFKNHSHIIEDFCVDGLRYPKVQRLFNETYDMIITSTGFSDCFVVFQHHFKVPFVLVNYIGATSPLDSWFGNPSFPSYDVTFFIGANPPLSFGMRVVNVLSNIAMHAIFYSWSKKKFDKARELLPKDMPPFEILYQNASLLIVNSYRVMETPKAYVPNIIHAGGLHLRATEPLPQDLEEWAQGSGDHGFIYFSLGSIVKTSRVPKKNLLAIVRAFGHLPQKILMKWDEDHIEELPDNVRLAKWLPQQDVLAHPKVRLFISHGGINSVQEALYHGVPILGLPIFSDQKNTLEKGARQGWALRLDWTDLTEETLMSALDTALNDTRIRDKARWMRALLQDQPRSPAETVIYWVEYVLRHGGARHLRCPAADMNWFFLYNCDIWITLATSLCIVVYTLYTVLRCSLQHFCHFKIRIKKKTN
ncbi:UDP-glucosyltransferase 2-like [Oratosquilla oratoria]|uniref:UDP-glucosyltransferase 2-like n=1 Tax=Oratosquilla oratoria TaxID=337810 RepID=UPI003F768BE0